METGKGTLLPYFKKSLRVWPIKGGVEQELIDSYGRFAKNSLRMIEKETCVRRNYTRASPNAPAYLEARVTFSNPDDRDFVASKSVNLAQHGDKDGKPRAGIGINVPSFLLSTFKDLNNYAYLVRKRHGKKLQNLN